MKRRDIRARLQPAPGTTSGWRRRLFEAFSFSSKSVLIPFLVSVIGTLFTQVLLFRWHPEDFKAYYTINGLSGMPSDTVMLTTIFRNMGRQSVQVNGLTLVVFRGTEQETLVDRR